jgi:hypothetical protein
MSSISLYPYQIDAVRRMKNGCILCGGVGSGKSRTAIAYYYICNGGKLETEECVMMRDNPMDIYIITTAKKRDTLEWEGELSYFLISPDPDATPYHHKVVIDSWNNIKKYDTVTDSFFIFDEQRVVGSGAWVKSFLKIARSNKWILLSATPGDSWMDYVPVFIANGYFKNRTEFIREHVVYKRFSKFPQVDRYLNTGRLVRMRNDILITMDFVRTTVSHHEDIYVGYDVKAYKDIVRTRWDIWKNKPLENAADYCNALRRVVNTSDARQIAVMEIFEDHPRVIIFYNYDYELDILRHLYYGENVEIAEWNGHKHQPIPECESWVYLVQYNSGSEGWNCIKTDTLIFYSQNYSYKVMVQASGRIDRLNTPYADLYYYHLKSRSGIDLAISKALSNKKQFNESAFVNGYYSKTKRSN